jgi:hypothetical protein
MTTNGTLTLIQQLNNFIQKEKKNLKPNLTRKDLYSP